MGGKRGGFLKYDKLFKKVAKQSQSQSHIERFSF